MPKCFIVCGPESSGNKMIAQILIEAGGCFGDADYKQRLDKGYDVAPFGKNVVLIRSFPHGSASSGDRRWPDLHNEKEWAELNGYEVVFIAITRAWLPTEKSQMDHGHVGTNDHAQKNLTEAMPNIMSQIQKHDLDYVLLTYESFVLHPDHETNVLLQRLGLPMLSHIGPDIKDENLKHYDKVEQRKYEPTDYDLMNAGIDYDRVVPAGTEIAEVIMNLIGGKIKYPQDALAVGECAFCNVLAMVMDLADEDKVGIVFNYAKESVNKTLDAIERAINELPRRQTEKGTDQRRDSYQNGNGTH